MLPVRDIMLLYLIENQSQQHILGLSIFYVLSTELLTPETFNFDKKILNYPISDFCRLGEANKQVDSSTSSKKGQKELSSLVTLQII